MDNEALTLAMQQHDRVLPVFVYHDGMFLQTEHGFSKQATARLKFLNQSLYNLRSNLKELGSNLLLLRGDAEEQISRLVSKHGILHLYLEEEYSQEELMLQDRLAAALPKVKITAVWGKTLYHKDDLPVPPEQTPITSKAFRISTTRHTKPREQFPVPEVKPTPNCDTWGDYMSPAEAKLDDAYLDPEPYVTGGEDAALERLHYYLWESELLTNYKWTRNRSLGMDYSSKFSPYMALGCISPRTIYDEVKKYETTIKRNRSTWWIMFEVMWRDFFTFKGMRVGIAMFLTRGYGKKQLDWTNNQEWFKRWCAGTTGIPFVDAHMRQLNATGYMSNRGRVNCSSYLIHDLKMDWTWGAAYFESRLIDYDVSSNWMNWHNQAYETWYTNPMHQSLKYKGADYIRTWIPELETADDYAVYLPWEHDMLGYPQPIAIYDKWQRSINRIHRAFGTESA